MNTRYKIPLVRGFILLKNKILKYDKKYMKNYWQHRPKMIYSNHRKKKRGKQNEKSIKFRNEICNNNRSSNSSRINHYLDRILRGAENDWL